MTMPRNVPAFLGPIAAATLAALLGFSERPPVFEGVPDAERTNPLVVNTRVHRLLERGVPGDPIQAYLPGKLFFADTFFDDMEPVRGAAAQEHIRAVCEAEQKNRSKESSRMQKE